jgi:molecular chaperone GrpE
MPSSADDDNVDQNPPGAGSPDSATADRVDNSALADDMDLAAMVGMDPVDGSEHARVLAERDDFLDSLRRLQADFDNYRKRVARDSDAAADKATEKLVNKLLPVLDNFELALAHEADPDASPLAKMHDSLLTALEGEGLERHAPIGEAFDPNLADAVMHEDGDGGEGGPIVTEVLRAGYGWKTRVIRPAMVKVRG